MIAVFAFMTQLAPYCIDRTAGESSRSVVGQLRLAGEPLAGVIVPSSAVVRVEGRTCVYLQRDKRTFCRREVSAAQPVEAAWFVSSGLASKDRVVVVGAQALLSEEFRSQIKLLE